MPLKPPTTRLREVATGLGSLARELEEITGVPPANLLWWQRELREVIVALERQQSPDEDRDRARLP